MLQDLYNHPCVIQRWGKRLSFQFSTHPTPNTARTGQRRALTVCKDAPWLVYQQKRPHMFLILQLLSPCCCRGWQCPRISVVNQCCTGQWWECWRKRPQWVADGQRGGRSQSGDVAPGRQPGSDWWMCQVWIGHGRLLHQWRRQTSALLSGVERTLSVQVLICDNPPLKIKEFIHLCISTCKCGSDGYQTPFIGQRPHGVSENLSSLLSHTSDTCTLTSVQGFNSVHCIH